MKESGVNWKTRRRRGESANKQSGPRETAALREETVKSIGGRGSTKQGGESVFRDSHSGKETNSSTHGDRC